MAPGGPGPVVGCFQPSSHVGGTTENQLPYFFINGKGKVSGLGPQTEVASVIRGLVAFFSFAKTRKQPSGRMDGRPGSSDKGAS